MAKPDDKLPSADGNSKQQRMAQDMNNPDGKLRRKRGKRGGKKRKRDKNQVAVSSPTSQTSKRGKRGGKRKRDKGKGDELSLQSLKTTWRPLEMEWFRSVDQSTEKIPDPVSLDFITKGEDSRDGDQDNSGILHELRRLFQKFSRKRQRQTKGTMENSWMPRPIQLQAWSILSKTDGKKEEDTFSGINIIGLSPTASGKTLAFGAPMVVAAARQPDKDTTNQLFGIVLVPTRELAQQVSRELEIMVSCVQQASQPTIRVLTCCGGDSQSTQDQLTILRKGPPGCRWLVSATPGRFLDIVQKCQEGKNIQFRHPSYIILDESDRLATNTDLAQQVTSILKACLSPQSTTQAFFSATYPHKAQEHWRQWMDLSERSCAMVRVDSVSLEKAPKKKQKREEAVEDGDESAGLESVVPGEEEARGDSGGEDSGNKRQSSASMKEDSIGNDFLSKIPAHLVQTLHVCSEHKKPRKLVNTLDKVRKEENGSRQKQLGIIFFGRIKTLQYISKLLKNQSSHDCLELHSQLPQHVRTKNMQTFQAGKVPVLLATDIAARGLHVSNVSFVINYDFPPNLEQYVHRCGRAGRNEKATNQKGMPPRIYSFFTRSMAPMALDLVALLESSKAWVDPNLKALVSEADQSSSRKKSSAGNKKSNSGPPSNERIAVMTSSDAIDETEALSTDDDAFPELSANKVVLKRASHVSDASSSSEEESD